MSESACDRCHRREVFWSYTRAGEPTVALCRKCFSTFATVALDLADRAQPQRFRRMLVDFVAGSSLRPPN